MNGKATSVVAIYSLLLIILFALHSSVVFAQPDFGQQWQKSYTPLFPTIGVPGSWNGVPTDQIDQLGHGLFDGSEYKIYFAGFNGQTFSIGLASSSTLESGWQLHPNNPILRPGPVGAWDQFHVGNPTVIHDDEIYKMWYVGYNASFISRIGLATSTDGINWIKSASNPVLDISPGGWDSYQLHTPYVIKIDDTYHMWYSGQQEFSSTAIGYATSPDGISWTRMSNDPVLQVGPFGSWEGNNIHTPMVLFENNRYHMWYLGASDEFLFGGTVQTGFALSNDGIVWAKDPSNPVLRNGGPGSLDSIVAAGLVIFKTDETTYRMAYGASDLATFFGGLLAELTPTRLSPPALLSPANEAVNVPVNPTFEWTASGRATSFQINVSKNSSFDNLMVDERVSQTTFVESNLEFGTRYFWRIRGFSSTDTSDWSTIRRFTTVALPIPPTPVQPANGATNVSTSPTLIWIPPNNVDSFHLQVSNSFDFDSLLFDVPGIKEFGYQLQGLDKGMQYFWRVNSTNSVGIGNWSVVFSFTTALTVSVEPIGHELPSEFQLLQNYPNPFNPETEIVYKLPAAFDVELLIYNPIGQIISTLVKQRQAAGVYSARWNGRDQSGREMASGLYFYRLQAGNFVQIRKMTLLR